MSLILEALKKSEQQRRLGEALTLGSPALAVRRGRSLLPLFGTLIVIAIGAGWWLLRPAQTAAPATAPVQTAATPSADTTATPMNRIKPAPAHAVPARPAEAKREPAKPMARGLEAVAPPLPITPPLNDRPGSVTQLPLPPPAIPAAAPSVASTTTHKPAAAAPAPPAAAPAANPPAASAPTAVVAQHPTPTAAAPRLPSVWDLPYATRKDLPDLTLTMHVYAPDPHERFVVIKGERHIEGDDLGSGVILREIRADGMVLDFKGTRFVYPRGGG